ncbi:hypothetical protein ASPZODRAFT_15034 [Penicilliopsis zonata CBS 506.65]|uniref:Chromosome segregation ATPase family protein n=1 Tax=Penicilliopsis zonata CBS 506.65 TaxID=1073090 RepID=A0A1L9SK18_9EURO|nr:hypothetical protein ASPZODRAFT_15034 [Penicilliopsis zonata CBS 506.65]OJJ47582.1 hypothetical protein ASPZODRAFT_15034 [Penicilliopsis zonata CBS 506.65]
MPSHEREGSYDRELVRHQSSYPESRSLVPMWDSSDPERAPPPLPMNPGSTSPVTKANASPNIQAVAASFAEKMRENAPSAYTVNPMPLKSSPEKSLIRGHYHKRMQSMQGADTRSEFLNYLESRSPERPLRASVMEPGTRQLESDLMMSNDSPFNSKDTDRDAPHFAMANRFLSKPILGGSTPPSATMLALQNMQLPDDSPPAPAPRSSSPPVEFSTPMSHNFESLSTQIHSLTDIASGLQREMAQLSRRSKDNATDLVSLKAATNARDEDIRKSLRELSSSISSRFSELEGATRWDLNSNSFLRSGDGIDSKESDSSPSSKKSYNMPRMPSPNPFAAAMERELCGSPTPISDGSASIALLEKVLREMATKEGQEKLLELVEEMKSSPVSHTSDPETDKTVTTMLEEILKLVREQPSMSNALVRARPEDLGDGSRSRSLDARDLSDLATMNEMNDNGNSDMTQEMLAIMKRVKSSVIEGGGLTNEVKALVRELRGEVLGMGRELGRKLEEAENDRLTDKENPAPLNKEEISAIVATSLDDLKEQMALMINESRDHSAAMKDYRSKMNSAEVYSLVRKAIDEFPLPEFPALPEGVRMDKEDILETVREAWETYKPEIELQNFGLEREEILECLSEGLKSYEPQHQDAVTYDQVLAAVQVGMQSFVPPPVESPPTITKDEISMTIRECLEGYQPPAPRMVEENELHAMRDEIMNALADLVTTTQSTLSRESFDSGIGRDEILSAVAGGLESHFAAVKEVDEPRVSREEVFNAINDAFAVHPAPEPPVSREEILALVTEALENQGAREIELSKDDLMEAISSCLEEATQTTNATIGEQVLERLQGLLDGMKEEFAQYSAANGKDTEQVLDALKDSMEVVRKDIETCTAAAVDENGKHEIMDTVKEGFRLLQADMEKTIQETVLLTQRGNPDTPELLDAMEKEFEHLRQTISTLLVRSNPGEKDEIIDAIREVADANKPGQKAEDVVAVVKEQIDNMREIFNMSIVPASQNQNLNKEELLSAIREHLDSFREQDSQQRDGAESILSNTGELLDAFHEGVDMIRADLDKLISKPVEVDNAEVLETIKEGLNSLRSEMEGLRDSHRELDAMESSRGQELTLANTSNLGDDIENLKIMITQLQIKVDAIETTPPPPAEFPEDVLKREDLDEVLVGLQEVQGSVAELVARPVPVDDTTAKKDDTDVIEDLLRTTKAHLEGMVFPQADEIAKAEQLGTLEAVVLETKEAISELSGRLEAEGPTKTEIGTLESLLKDIYLVVEELKAKATPGEDEDTAKLMKSDLQTVEAMIFEVKTQVEELKLPDVDSLPTKTELQELSALVVDFREKVEAENELTAQAFEARKVEHGGLAEKIEEAQAVVNSLSEELKSKLDGSSEGLSELRQLLEGLIASSEMFTTVESVKELTDLINREFERARGEQDAAKLETEERDAVNIVKQDETRAAIIVELGAKIDEKVGEVMAKYEEAQATMESKFSEAEERDGAHLEAVTDTKSIAEDIRLVIGAMGDSLTETCERMGIDTKTFLEKVDESYKKIEEMHNDVKSHQEQARVDVERAVAATDRVESKLGEIHPQLLESIQEILAIVGQHYEHSQNSSQELTRGLTALPMALTPLLPALPPPEPEKYDDSQVQDKLNTIIEHARNREIHEKLDDLVESSQSNRVVNEKLDTLLEQTTTSEIQDKLNILLEHAADTNVHDKLNILVENSTNHEIHDKLNTIMEFATNDQVHEKLDTLINHTTSPENPVHEKLDTLLDRSIDTSQSVTQMMKLDEMHKDIMETSRRMNEMFEAQSKMIAEDNERRRRESEEIAMAIERRTAQKEQIEAELVGLAEEKDSLLKMIYTLKGEKDDLSKQKTKLATELSGLETALEIRHEEMQLMEERADSLEKRILEGVLDHARSVLLRGPAGGRSMGVKRVRSTRTRDSSAASNASTARDARSILGSGAGIALKRRSHAPSQSGSTAASSTAGKERRILSLSNVTGNRGVVDRQSSTTSGFTSLKRSHSVKSDLSLRKASWAGRRTSLANKENDVFVEEEEQNSGGESDTGTERRTSYAGTFTDNMRRVSTASSATGLQGTETGSVVIDHGDAGDRPEEEHSEDEEPANGDAEADGSELADGAAPNHDLDSGLGSEMVVAV